MQIKKKLSGSTSTGYTLFTDDVAPSSSASLTETRSSASSATVTWTKPTVSDFSYTKLEIKKVVNGVETDISSEDTTGNSKTYTNLINQTKYKYYATSYDWSGNASSTVSFVDNTPPAKVVYNWTEGKNTRRNQANLRFRWFR